MRLPASVRLLQRLLSRRTPPPRAVDAADMGTAFGLDLSYADRCAAEGDSELPALALEPAGQPRDKP